jgi:hypothetical protein
MELHFIHSFNLDNVEFTFAVKANGDGDFKLKVFPVEHFLWNANQQYLVSVDNLFCRKNWLFVGNMQ